MPSKKHLELKMSSSRRRTQDWRGERRLDKATSGSLVMEDKTREAMASAAPCITLCRTPTARSITIATLLLASATTEALPRDVSTNWPTNTPKTISSSQNESASKPVTLRPWYPTSKAKSKLQTFKIESRSKSTKSLKTSNNYSKTTLSKKLLKQLSTSINWRKPLNN